jgi:hypothetical protein
MWNKVFILFILVSCSSMKDDPLRNSKKLVKDGHKSLYQNGAFSVPSTKIMLIPPGPDAITLAKELSGLKAKESFLKYLHEVKSSSVVIYEGTKKSYELAKTVNSDVARAMDRIAPQLKKDSTVIMDSSLAASRNIIGKSWELGNKIGSNVSSFGKKLGNDLKSSNQKTEPFTGSEKFILGYVSLPGKLKSHQENIVEAVSFQRYIEDFQKAETTRKQFSKSMTYWISDSFRNYGKDVSQSFNNAQKELNDSDNLGPSFGGLKAIAWLLNGVLWQGVIKPVGKASGGAIGYVISNGVVYTLMLVSRGGVTTGTIAVEVAAETGKGLVEVTAPTAELALSAILYSGEYLANKAIEKSSRGAGIVLENGITYIAAPASNVLVKTGGMVSGVALGVGGPVLAGATRASGELMGLSSQVISKTAAAGVFTGGVVVHTLKGSAEVAYEITKASVVPPSMVLGSGLTLSYGTLSQLAGHTVLAASDAAYLVLSLEGPNWVVYSVKGLVASDDLPANTVIDLQKLRNDGEVIQKVPVTEEEMTRLLNHL